MLKTPACYVPQFMFLLSVDVLLVTVFFSPADNGSLLQCSCCLEDEIIFIGSFATIQRLVACNGIIVAHKPTNAQGRRLA